MIRAALFHKLYGLLAALLGIFLIASILSTEAAEYYFTLTSAVQLSIPFVGFGLSQSLVGNKLNNNKILLSSKDRYLLIFFFVISLISLIAVSKNYISNDLSLLIYAVFFLLLTSYSELIRTAFSNHKGFIIINTVVILTSLSVYFKKDFSYAMVFIPISAFIIFSIYTKSKGYSFSTKKQHETLTDFNNLLKAIRVSIFNQFYNITIVSIAIFGNLSESFSLILIYRLNVLLNWQVFYWLRFAHKKSALGLTKETFHENRKIAVINILSIGLLNLSFIVGYYFNIFEALGIKFITLDFIIMTLIFSAFKIILSLTFPFELFTIYAKNDGVGNRLLVLITFLIFSVSLLTYLVDNKFIILVLIELILILSRIISWKAFRHVS